MKENFNMSICMEKELNIILMEANFKGHGRKILRMELEFINNLDSQPKLRSGKWVN